uniref:Uncharacterized protein n=1 Tax=Oryza brachyantha TaxID=4533 RepID=J3M2T4_ORYBR
MASSHRKAGLDWTDDVLESRSNGGETMAGFGFLGMQGAVDERYDVSVTRYPSIHRLTS